ncbi:CvpA family protein [Imhoffiella purpurea]|uniref:Colicin V production protein n=1 Tax=Imhoffiella purpurea TaxID=1249627 RepID=W9V5N7_9GAMM|nr:CvpA family protein [Imhoffiella purpurea]EXJ14684.1 Colicin V production protein [Imhoffiella purpurea]
MNWVDYLIISIIVVSALVGVARGLIREVLALGVWILALLVAWLFHRDVADLLIPYLSQPALRMLVAFAVLVVVILFLGAILGAILVALVDRAGLNGVDRFLGLGFGAARGVLIVAMAVFLAALTPLPSDPVWAESSLLGDFQDMADWLLERVPEDVKARLKAL